MLVAAVRIGYTELALDWVRSVAILLETIEACDDIDPAVADEAANVRAVMWHASSTGAD